MPYFMIQHFNTTGVRRFFVVDSYEQFATFLRKWDRRRSPHSCRRLRTGDFSTLYTTIPHDDLVRCITDVIAEAFEFIDKEQPPGVGKFSTLHVSAEDAQWTTTPRPHVGRSRDNVPADTPWQKHVTDKRGHSRHEFSREALSAAVRLLIDNIYIENGGRLRKQRRGMPMGTNCAPVLANLYLYWYESRFIDRLYDSEGALAASLFHASFRYIDDVLSVDNPLWLQWSSLAYEDGGIYPSALQLNDTTLDNGHRVHYVGTTISNVHRHDVLVPAPAGLTDAEVGPFVHIDVFDKRKEFPFTVRLYPSMSSLIPTSIPYAVFTGQLHRYHSICSQTHLFFRHALRIHDILVERGCTRQKLLATFAKFLKKKYDAHLKAELSQFVLQYPRLDHRRMIREFGILTRGALPSPRADLAPILSALLPPSSPLPPSPLPPSPPPPSPPLAAAAAAASSAVPSLSFSLHLHHS